MQPDQLVEQDKQVGHKEVESTVHWRKHSRQIDLDTFHLAEEQLDILTVVLVELVAGVAAAAVVEASPAVDLVLGIVVVLELRQEHMISAS